MYQEYAISKSNLKMIQSNYGSYKRADIYKDGDSQIGRSLAYMECRIITKYINRMLARDQAWECVGVLSDYYDNEIALGTIINQLLLSDSGKGAGESEVVS